MQWIEILKIDSNFYFHENIYTICFTNMTHISNKFILINLNTRAAIFFFFFLSQTQQLHSIRFLFSLKNCDGSTKKNSDGNTQITVMATLDAQLLAVGGGGEYDAHFYLPVSKLFSTFCLMQQNLEKTKVCVSCTCAVTLKNILLPNKYCTLWIEFVKN